MKHDDDSEIYYSARTAYGYILEYIADSLFEIVDGRTTCVAGEGVDGMPLATALSLRYKFGLAIPRLKLKGHGDERPVEGYRLSYDDKVACVDGTCNTGGTFAKMITLLEAEGAEVVCCSAVINRGEIRSIIVGKRKIPIYSLFTLDDMN